jgi:hypothetical protein
VTTAPTAPPAEYTLHPGGSGLPNSHLIPGKTAGDWIIRAVLAIVMTAALAVGTWSIYTLLTQQLQAPTPIAVLGCGMFDVAALFFALLSQKYAVTTDSGLAPRAAMLAMICTSSWINWRHGQMEGWGTVGSVILAAAPVIAELSFEMFHRYAHREALRQLGRVAQALPVLGKWSWLAHPLRSRRALDAHIRATLTEHEAIADRRRELAAARARQIVTVPAEVRLGPIPVHEPAAPAVNRASHSATPEPVREPAVKPALEPTPEVHEPAPRKVANFEPQTRATPKRNTNRAPANLGDRSATKRTQIEEVLNLIGELGYDATTLTVVRERTGMTKTTAYHRLTDARTEWNQRHAS